MLRENHTVLPEDLQTATCQLISNQIDNDSQLPDSTQLFNVSSSRDYGYAGPDPLVLKRIQMIPDDILSHYDNPDKRCRMGLLVDINHAWMTIDNRLFLWSYDDGLHLTKHEENQMISLVDLVKPKQDVFVPSIKYILVVICPLRVNLLGIEANSDKSIILHSTNFTFHTDDINMLTISGTLEGRIFLGGQDGHIHELEYNVTTSTTTGWSSSHSCKKVNRTISTFTALLPGFLKPNCSSISNLQVDDFRGLIWILTDDNSLIVYSFEPKSTALNFISRFSDIYESISRLTSIGTITRKGSQIIGMNVVHNKSQIQLAAITSSGARLYFTTSKFGTSYGPISLMHVRLSPGEDPRSRPTSWLTSTHFAYYKSGQFIAASSCNSDDCIWSISFNYPAILSPSRPWPSENFGEVVIEGKVWDIAETSDKHPQNESAELIDPSYSNRNFVVLTNMGTYQFNRLRPVDILKDYISKQDETSITKFFESYTPEQASSMCLKLALTSDEALANHATSTLIKFGGQLKSYVNNTGRIELSPMHQGFYMFVSRCLSHVWNSSICAIKKGSLNHPLLHKLIQFFERNPTLLRFKSSYNPSKLSPTKDEHANLQSITENLEIESLRSLQALISWILQLGNFLDLCYDYDIFTYIQKQSQIFSNSKSICLHRTLAETVCKKIHSSLLIKELASALVHKQLSIQAPVETLCDVLSKRCPLLFAQDDLLIYKATEDIHQAKSCTNPSDSHTRQFHLERALHSLCSACQSITLEELIEFFKQFQSLAFHRGVVSLGLERVRHFDPNNLSLALYKGQLRQIEKISTEQSHEIEAREQIYTLILLALKDALEPHQLESYVVIDDVNLFFKNCLKTALQSSDELFHYFMYDWLVNDGQFSRLLDLRTPYLESYLCDHFDKNSQPHMDLLWKYLLKLERFKEASECLVKLANNSELKDLSLESRIEYLSLAIINSKSAKDDAVTDLQDRLDVALVQLEVLTEFKVLKLDNEDYLHHLHELESRLLSLTVLFNQFARPYNLSESGLAILHCARHSEPLIMAQFWNQIFQRYSDVKTLQIVEKLGQHIRTLSQKFYPSEFAFPLGYVMELLFNWCVEHEVSPIWYTECIWSCSAIPRLHILNEIIRIRDNESNTQRIDFMTESAKKFTEMATDSGDSCIKSSEFKDLLQNLG